MAIVRIVDFGARVIAVPVVVLLCVFASQAVSAQSGNSNGRNPNQAILDRLDAIEAKIDDLAGESVSATFCISQGREGAFEAAYKLVAEAELEGGLGWAEVFSGEGTAEVKFPGGPIPSETAVKLGGAHGRGFDICVDLPIELGDRDTELLAELAADINVKANDFPFRGKFQRRAHRVLNYAKRRVPGVQIRTDSETAMATPMAERAEGAADEFDTMDVAIENMMTSGVQRNGDPLGAFRDPNVRALLTSFGEIPVDIQSMINEPEMAFDPLSDISTNGFANTDCASFGIGASLRGNRPGLDRLCSRLETLPTFDRVEQVLSGELIADIYEALDTLTIGNSAATVSSSARDRFCATRIGQLFKYNNFCNR